MGDYMDLVGPRVDDATYNKNIANETEKLRSLRSVTNHRRSSTSGHYAGASSRSKKMPQGPPVMLVGLTKAQYNGRTGTIVGKTSYGRLTVKLDNSEEINVKPENVDYISSGNRKMPTRDHRKPNRDF